jgi:hypothetical protein
MNRDKLYYFLEIIDQGEKITYLDVLNSTVGSELLIITEFLEFLHRQVFWSL